MATYLADRVIVYDGQPSVHAHANKPESLLTGMNKFLDALQITFRRDPTNYRPRINKFDSVKDKEQKVIFNLLDIILVSRVSLIIDTGQWKLLLFGERGLIRLPFVSVILVLRDLFFFKNMLNDLRIFNRGLLFCYLT